MYLQYNDQTKLVVSITEVSPGVVAGYSIVQSNIYIPGDEFELSIYIMLINEDGVLLEHASVRNNPTAVRLLQENVALKAEVITLKFDSETSKQQMAQTNADLTSVLEMMLLP